MKMKRALESSQLIVLIDPLANKFSDKEAENCQNDMQIRYEASEQWSLKFHQKDS